MGFSRQEQWSGSPFPSPMHESEKWKWSHSVMSDSLQSHRLQTTRLLCPWDFPGKSTGVGCHCLLRYRGTTASKLEDLLIGRCGTSLLLLLCQWNKQDHQWRERAGKRGLCRGVRCEIIIRITILALNSIYCVPHIILGFPCGLLVENLPAMGETWVRSLGWEDSLEKGKATHFSILAWRIPWTV